MKLSIKLLILYLFVLVGSVHSLQTSAGTEYAVQANTYGKYFTLDQHHGGPQECNTYYLYMPSSSSDSTVPLVAQFHGGGFTSGNADQNCNEECQGFLDNGIAYASFDYRLVATKYYRCPTGGTYCANKLEEEFIHASANGTLTLDTTGKAMSQYKVRNRHCFLESISANHIVLIYS